MEIVITPCGTIRLVYEEGLDLHALGAPLIRRASQVEPDSSGHWSADLSPMQGPILGPFPLRSQALDAERRWLRVHWLVASHSL